jgi:NADPH-dependent 2,4-dienoyl-CoA reductase/sulfur reductase-like enzyme
MTSSSHIFAALIAAFLTGSLAADTPSTSTDLVVYGGTASGVMTAYSAAREGLHVVLLEPGLHLGGMVTGGLSATDLGQFTIIGGYARDFYMQAAAHSSARQPVSPPVSRFADI